MHFKSLTELSPPFDGSCPQENALICRVASPVYIHVHIYICACIYKHKYSYIYIYRHVHDRKYSDSPAQDAISTPYARECVRSGQPRYIFNASFG